MNWTGVFVVWGVIGALVTPYLPSPGTKLQALLVLAISGPVGWIIFIVMGAHIHMENKKTDSEH